MDSHDHDEARNVRVDGKVVLLMALVQLVLTERSRVLVTELMVDRATNFPP